MTPDEMREIKQRANAAELPHDRTVNRLKANLRECLAEIAVLEERSHLYGDRIATQNLSVIAQEKRIAELEVALKIQGEGFLDQITALVNPLEAAVASKDTELERLRTGLKQLCEAAHKRGPEDVEFWATVKEAEEALKKPLPTPETI